MYLSIYMFLDPMGTTLIDTLNHGGIIGLSLYLDPSSWVMHLGFFMCHMNKVTAMQNTIGLCFCRCLMMIMGDYKEQVHNLWNYLLITDNYEN